MPIDLVRLEQAEPAWQELVTDAPDASVFHHPAWGRVLADTYGYRPIALASLDGRGRPAAGVLLTRVRRPTGPAWVSLPFSDHCPPLARDPVSLSRLAAGLADWSTHEGVPIEVRGNLPPTAGWNEVAIGVRHVLSLTGDVASLRTGLYQDHRRRLRQAERSGLGVRFGRSPDDVADFYRLHVQTRRRQGVPVQPRRFFDAIWRNVIAPGLGVVALVGEPGRPIAAYVVFAWNKTAIGKFQPSDPACWKLRPNHLLYWAVIHWARETGCSRFDFGRTETRHDGLQRFKSGWGAEAIPLSYARAGGDTKGAGDNGLLGAALGHVIRRSPAFVCRGLGALLYRFAA
jgi:CelD/BcsL family acetyltransferase involved in cellulose biosynthesis